MRGAPGSQPADLNAGASQLRPTCQNVIAGIGQSIPRRYPSTLHGVVFDFLTLGADVQRFGARDQSKSRRVGDLPLRGMTRVVEAARRATPCAVIIREGGCSGNPRVRDPGEGLF